MDRLPIIGIMGSHTDDYADYARPLGQLVARLGCHLLTGGGTGVMQVASEAFVTTAPRRGVCLGIIPTQKDAQGAFAPKAGYPNPFVEVPILTPLSHFTGGDQEQITRNHVNILTSDVIVALPGKNGTANEVGLAVRFQKPLILFGPREAFDAFPADIQRTENLADVKAFILPLIAHMYIPDV